MRQRQFIIIVTFGLLSMICNTQEGYIRLQSLDLEQDVKFDAEEVQLFPGYTLDSTLIHELMQDNNCCSKDLSDILESTSDTTSIVFRIDRYLESLDHAYSIRLFGVCSNRRITRLYLYEAGEIPIRNWGLTESAGSIGSDSTINKIKLNAVMKAIDFQTGASIRFPGGGPNGTYDYTIDRYILIECEFTVPKEYLKYFPPIFGPSPYYDY